MNKAIPIAIVVVIAIGAVACVLRELAVRCEKRGVDDEGTTISKGGEKC